jgi:hypothetical protein
MLYCSKCGNEASADKNDYFWASDDLKLRCHHGTRRIGKVMKIVTKRTVIEEVK